MPKTTYVVVGGKLLKSCIFAFIHCKVNTLRNGGLKGLSQLPNLFSYKPVYVELIFRYQRVFIYSFHLRTKIYK